MAFYCPFDIDLPKAVKEQLVDAFKTLTPAALAGERLNEVPEKKRGVYQLYYKGTQVYVGKATDLRSRLWDHHTKISGRKNIQLADMSFTCLSISRNWTALAPESQLIEVYKQQGGSAWNGKGFGPHDPGSGREERNRPPAWFDTEFPIREDWPCSTIEVGEWNVGALLEKLKRDLPFLLRFQRVSKKKGHPDYNDLRIQLPESAMSAERLLRLIAQRLPEGWQATRFDSHIILYKEMKTFKYGSAIWPAESAALVG